MRERSIPVASLLTEAKPTHLGEDTLTLEFPAGADFHRRQVAEPQNIGLLRDALYEVTGRKLAVVKAPNMAGVKEAQGVPTALRSCHTALIDGVVVEGHVPPEDIKRLFPFLP